MGTKRVDAVRRGSGRWISVALGVLLALAASRSAAAASAVAAGGTGSEEKRLLAMVAGRVDGAPVAEASRAAVEGASAGEDGLGGSVARPPIAITTFVDVYSAYRFAGGGGDTALRAFDAKQDQLSLAVLEVALEQEPTVASRLGFRADLNFGPTADSLIAFEPGDRDTFRAFEQAYGSYLAPLGGGLRLDLGKFVTPHGAEVIAAMDNWNYTRGLLFTWAIPFYHVGLRATLPLGERLTVSGFAVNGWNNAVENNGGKTFGLGATLQPGRGLTLVQNVMAGPELAGDARSDRWLSDTTVIWTATPRLSLMANLDYGRDDNAAGPAASWRGVALYARAQLGGGWALASRVERLADRDGFATGTPQTLEELTLTGELAAAGGLLLRLEARRDRSSVALFERDGGRRSRSQETLTLGVIYAFARDL